MNTSNLKDTLSTIFAALLVLSGAIVTIGQAGVVLPPALVTAGIIVGVLAGAGIGFLTGKAPSGAVKTDIQVAESNSEITGPDGVVKKVAVNAK